MEKDSQLREYQKSLQLYKYITINNSKSKFKFSFGRDKRFKDIKLATSIHAYDKYDPLFCSIRDQSNKSKPVNNQGFGSSIKRFEYLHLKKLAQLPSPVAYKIHRNYDSVDLRKSNSTVSMISLIDKKSVLSKNLSPSIVTPLRNSLDGKLYTFGVGREKMQPLHID